MLTRLAVTAALSLAAVSIAAQSTAPKPDTLVAANGPITIAPLNHATLELTWNNHIILVDPTGALKHPPASPPRAGEGRP